jgi:myo-inositol-1(or 4)-monophosphatase
MSLPVEVDWLALCRRAAGAARLAVGELSSTAERAVEQGRGEGGDTTLALDSVAEDAIFGELQSARLPLMAVSEERGEVWLSGGPEGDAQVRVVVDPVDGSLNAKRGLPFSCVSIAVASGSRMADVEVGLVCELDSGREWWAVRGEGAHVDGRRLEPLAAGPLEVLGLETVRPELIARQAEAIAATGARRVRALGSVAVSMCLVAGGRLDGMITLREIRSVDVAAGQLIVEEAGGAVTLPGGDKLDLGMRSRAAAARSPQLAERLLATVA